MKKLFALLLALCMVTALFAGCQENPTPTEPEGTDPIIDVTDPTDDQVTIQPEALPENPLLYWDFESLEGLKAVEQIKDGTTITGIGDSAHEILTADGVVGKSLYLDGKYGIELDMNDLDIADDSYTISFWIYAERIGDFMPIVQLGRNMNHADNTEEAKTKEGAVAWLNFTRGVWAETYPLAWNRNTSIPWVNPADAASTSVFPWIAGPADVVNGKEEWCLVTLVVDGNRYTCLDDNGERIGTRYYLNGELVFDASAEFLYYQGVAPELFTGSPVSGFIGINYWDSVYKGYVDELVIYDEALTAGQVVSLYQKGDTTVTPEAPVATDPEPEPEPVVLPEITPDASAIDVVGSVERNTAFWGDWSKGWALEEGASVTVKLNNYGSAANVWNNYNVVFANVETPGHTAPADTAGYAEYAVVRSDPHGWGDASYAMTAQEKSWTNDADFMELMKDSEVTLVITRNGAEIVIDATLVGADGTTTMTSKYTIATSLTADSDCYFFFVCDGSYLEILSVN